MTIGKSEIMRLATLKDFCNGGRSEMGEFGKKIGRRSA